MLVFFKKSTLSVSVSLVLLGTTLTCSTLALTQNSTIEKTPQNQNINSISALNTNSSTNTNNETTNKATNFTVLDSVVATVGNDVITNTDLNSATTEALKQAKIINPTSEQFDKQRVTTFRQLVMRKVQLNIAQRYGIKVDDNQIDAALTNYAQKQNFADLEQFAKALDRSEPGKYAQIRTQVGEDLAIERLRQQIVGSRAKITEKEVDTFLASPDSQIQLSAEYRAIHITIVKPQNPNDQNVHEFENVVASIYKDLNSGATVAELKKKYKNSPFDINAESLNWIRLSQMPTLFADALRVMNVGQSSNAIDTPVAVHIFKLQEKRGGEKTIIKQKEVRHILVTTSPTMSDADAKTRINDIYNDLTQKHADFATLAQKYSNDPGSARNGGSLGWVSPGEMVASFEEQMDTTPVGSYSKPFRTQFGWHILQVQNQRDYDNTENYRRMQARKILMDRKYSQEYENWLRELQATSYVDIKDPVLAKSWQ